MRSCWCKESAVTCPVHVLGPVVQACGNGQRLFSGIPAAEALVVLRVMLGELGVVNPDSYRTHDLRRGHALDLQMSGAPLNIILAAGEWRSPAFMEYMDLNRLEGDVVVQAHVDESSDEDGA